MEKLVKSIKLFIDEKEVDYHSTPLINDTSCFKVDYRIKVDVPIPDTLKEHKLKILLPTILKYNTKAIQETDENLFAVSFYIDDNKLCIGTIGDIISLKYQNDNCSITIEGFFPCNMYTLFLSYVMNINSQTEIYPWLAVDPSFECSK